MNNNILEKKKVLVISGASSGIGLATAKYFSKNGYIVYGLSRRQFDEKGIISISCDVTDKIQVKNAISNIFDKEKQIDILINNAGFGISGSIENQKIDFVKKQFDVNFIGAVNLTQEVLPIMRLCKKGKIFNTSSVASIIPIPFQSFYCASKASLDIWAKCLSLEVKPFNINVCNVLVGDTKTGFTSGREKSDNKDEGVYSKIVYKSISKMEKDEQNGKDPISVAKIYYKLAQKRKIPYTTVIGSSYKLIALLQKILPQRFVMWVVKKLYC